MCQYLKKINHSNVHKEFFFVFSIPGIAVEPRENASRLLVDLSSCLTWGTKLEDLSIKTDVSLFAMSGCKMAASTLCSLIMEIN